MIIRIFILAVIFAGVSRVALASSQRELRGLLEAKSLKELDTRQRSAAKISAAHESCEAELRLHLLPRSCFHEIGFAKSSSEKAHQQIHTGDFDQKRRLTRLCIESAKLSVSRLDLRGPVQDLPNDCQKVIAERIDDLRYIDEAARPESSVMRTSGPDLEDASVD